ncbi:DNA repair exonuclease SbcCD ATPase subunit, partial [Virgibacillus natechei]
MSSDSLSRLQQRKTAVNQDIGNARERISAAEDKVKRLQKISSSMQTSIYSLRNIKGNIDDFEVTKAKWEGDQENQFIAKYNSYGVLVGIYDS